jgi:FkbM family methyltransferase
MGNSVIRKFRKLIRLMRNSVYRKGLMHNVAANIEHELLCSSLELDQVVDIGANKGQFSLMLLGVSPKIEVIAFEPLPKAAKIFTNLFRGYQRVSILQYAIGSENGTSAIHVANRSDSSSLLAITKNQTEHFPGTDEVDSFLVETRTLDSIIDSHSIMRKSLLKIDVQGFEMEVLLGSEKLLSSFQYVYVECSFVELYEGQALANQIVSWLTERGFVLRGIYNASSDNDGMIIQGDFLFYREQDS